MTSEEMKARTKRFASSCLDLVEQIPSTIVGRVLSNQLARSSTSVAANYRAACKGRSKAEFVSKLGAVEEEADECQLWLELVAERIPALSMRIPPVLQEAREITAIVAAARKTANDR